MSVSLYRKYRPQRFQDVVGQGSIEATLRNAIDRGTVAHAYLFCGPRGTGKTTTARLVAKALLCDHGVSADPCGTCESCRQVAEGRHPDVYELDAATRTGVENVREEIISRVAFAPSRGAYKVYVIDEVHMLSVAAFNALLKTLEEPPSHIVFILCTTDPQKVPDTILSRCQRFDFKCISVSDIKENLRRICEGEGFGYEDAALELIARHASGGMRDAITSLEQLAVFSKGTISYADAEGLFGDVASDQLFELAGLIAHRDVAGCFGWVERFSQAGTGYQQLIEDLTMHVRNLYVALITEGRPFFADVVPDGEERYLEQARSFGGPDRLVRLLTLLGELLPGLKQAENPRLLVEIALTRMVRPDADLTLESLAERIEALEASRGVVVPSAAAAPSRLQVAAEAETPPAPEVPAPGPDGTASEAGASEPDRSVVEETTVPEPVQTVPARGQVFPVPSAEAVAGPVSRSDDDPSAAMMEQGTEQGTGSPVPDTGSALHSDEDYLAAAGSGVAGSDKVGIPDDSAAQRVWATAFKEVKAHRPQLMGAYRNTTVRHDADNGGIIIEFAAGSDFTKGIAEEHGNLEFMKTALERAAGHPVPFRLVVGLRGPTTSVPAATSGKMASRVEVPAAADVETSSEEASRASESMPRARTVEDEGYDLVPDSAYEDFAPASSRLNGDMRETDSAGDDPWEYDTSGNVPPSAPPLVAEQADDRGLSTRMSEPVGDSGPEAPTTGAGGKDASGSGQQGMDEAQLAKLLTAGFGMDIQVTEVKEEHVEEEQ